MVLPYSVRIPRVPTYSGFPLSRPLIRLRGFHPLRPAFPKQFCFKFRSRVRVLHPAHIAICGLGSSDFARHYFRNRFYFLFLALLRCFSSGGSPHIPIDSVYDVMTLLITDCSIRTSADQHLLAIPRSFSQLTASFIGSQCQGILPALLLAWPSFHTFVLLPVSIMLLIAWSFLWTFYCPSKL